jgi:spermidine/putrescine transport system substrate-binding protein
MDAMTTNGRPSSPIRWGTPVSRRGFLRAAGGVAGAAALAPILAACGTSEPGGPFSGPPAGRVDFANWPLYLDRGKDAQGNVTRPSLQVFTEDTGIAVNYREVIPDAESFYQKIQPYLAAGEPSGWDIMVITNGLTLTKLIELEQVLPLPKDQRPNFDANADPLAKDPAYDPGATYTMPWQSGITGIAYNPALTGRPITSIQDLFSQEFAGRVGMFGDNVDLPNFAMIAAGIDPVTSTPGDWQKAAALLRQQQSDGVVARYFTQSYVNALQNGDVALSMAWSGDIFQVNAIGNPRELQFVVPEEGALLWTDNMCIPKGALHPVDAITLMDFVYRPDIAAMIAAYCAYVTPVPAAKDQLLTMAGDSTNADRAAVLRSVADSPLVFLPQAERDKLKTYRELTRDEEISQWDDAFSEFFV